MTKRWLGRFWHISFVLFGLALMACSNDPVVTNTTPDDNGAESDVADQDAGAVDASPTFDTSPNLDTSSGLDAGDTADPSDVSSDHDASTPDTATPDTADPDTEAPDAAEADTIEPDVAEPDTGQPDADVPEVCPELSHSLPQDTRHSYNVGNNPNYPGSSTEMLWIDEPEGQITQQMTLLRDHYAALGFETGDPAVGSTDFEALSSLVTQPSSIVLALSQCPGQFVGLPEWCVNTGHIVSIFWSVGYPDEDYPFNCALEPDTTYYLNIAHAPSPEELDESSCSDAEECGNVFVHRVNP